MKTKFILFSLILLQGLSGRGYSQAVLSAVKSDSKIDIYINRKFLFTSYITSPYEKYPFFFPVNGPSGAGVTSMRNGNYQHHSSLFFGCDLVNGGNYWQEGLDRGQILSLRADIVEESGERVVIENECIWKRPGADAPVKDIRKIIISAPSDEMYRIDIEITMEMLMDVTIGRTNHSLFSARMDPDLAVISGGTMINAEGDRGEKNTLGKPSAWMDYYGNRRGKTEGLAILQHPSSAWYPAPWFTRDYGFFSPTPMNWPEDPEKGTFFRKGDKIFLRYRVLVHSGDHIDSKIAEEFEKYKSE